MLSEVSGEGAASKSSQLSQTLACRPWNEANIIVMEGGLGGGRGGVMSFKLGAPGGDIE